MIGKKTSDRFAMGRLGGTRPFLLAGSGLFRQILERVPEFSDISV